MSDECKYIQFLFPNKALRNAPAGDTDKAHSVIGGFMTSHGFEERKYTEEKGVYYTYTSEKEMTAEEASTIVAPLFGEISWLEASAKYIRMTEVGKTVSLLDKIKQASAGEQN